MIEPRIHRSVEEMCRSLRSHVDLLRTYLERAQTGEDQYLGEIAGKLRVLVVSKGSNKPLLIRLARLCNYSLVVQLGDQPPLIDGPKPFERIPFTDWLEDLTVAFQTPSSAPELVHLTREDLITHWSQQAGAAHEDWSHSESFQILQKDEVFIGGVPASQRTLFGIGLTVLQVAEDFLDSLDPELIKGAERKRQEELNLPRRPDG